MKKHENPSISLHCRRFPKDTFRSFMDFFFALKNESAESDTFETFIANEPSFYECFEYGNFTSQRHWVRK